MAIVKMNKFTLLAFESQKDELLEELQKFEGVQFINLQNEELLESNEELKVLKKDSLGENFGFYEDSLSKVRFSIEFLTPYMKKKSAIDGLIGEKKNLTYEELKSSMKESKWKDIYEDVKSKEERLTNLANEVTKLQTEINTLSLWRGFDAPFKELKGLKYTSYFIGTMAKQYEGEFTKEFNENISYGYVDIINSDNQDIYLYALVSKEEAEKASEVLKNFGFSSFSLNYDEKPSNIIDEYKKSIYEIMKEEENIKESLKGYKEKYEELQVAFEYFNTNLIKLKASENFLKTDKVVTICGWITKESNKEFETVIKKAVGEDYYLNFSEVEEEEIEEVPIKLRNAGFAGAFEGIVEMYSLPLYREVDPTPILSVFYFLFFGMMLSDAGYGIVMVIASAIALKMAKDEEKKKNFKLFFYAGISTIIWGAIYGGWFGDLFPTYFGIKIPYLLEPASNITQVFIMSLAFGIVHIFIGLGIKAYILIRDKHFKDAVYDVFTWYLTLIGSILLLVGVGKTAGKYMLIVGLIGLLLTQGRSAPSLGGKIGGGIYGVYGITGYLGDVVSYSRLLALGLATGFIANALNLIVSLVPKPLVYVLAPIMFIGLHLFNLLINALGSYVHAARLQYLEFFSKFYEGGGKKFTPYKPSEEYVKITK